MVVAKYCVPTLAAPMLVVAPDRASELCSRVPCSVAMPVKVTMPGSVTRLWYDYKGVDLHQQLHMLRAESMMLYKF